MASMTETNTILDPDGDILVILRNPKRIQILHVREGPDFSEPESSEPESNGIETAVTEPNSNPEAQLAQPDAVAPEECYFKSSSKHLASASPRFKRMMNGPWREATELHAGELRHWIIEEFTARAMTIVLCVIHVDYIGCYEVMEHYASIWIRHLEDKIPESYNDELFLWICIAGVFHDSRIFKRCTHTAIIGHHDRIDMSGLPILPEISDEITRRKISHLDKIFEHIYGLLDDLTNGLKCSFECDAIKFGALTKYMHAYSLSPRSRTHQGLSIAWVVEIITNLPMVWRHRVYGDHPNLATVASSGSIKRSVKNWHIDWRRIDFHCGFNELISKVKRVAAQVEGLDLQNLDIRRAE